jgi:uncharacterized glyoxalase superfamily protein PhnB
MPRGDANSEADMAEISEVYPYLRVHDAAAAIKFYEEAFGARELSRLQTPDGRIGHAEIRIGPATLMLSDEYPAGGIRSPRTLGGTTFSIHLHADDVDAAFERAVRAGAAIVRPLETSSMASARGCCAIPSVMNGFWAAISKTSRRKKCSAAIRNC